MTSDSLALLHDTKMCLDQFSVVDKCGIFAPSLDDKPIELDDNNDITALTSNDGPVIF